MSGALYLAFAHLRHHGLRSCVLIFSMALIIAVPLTVRDLLSTAQARLTERAEGTALVVGARGSRLDLVMGALYFSQDRPGAITYAQVEQIWESGYAAAIPLHLGYRAAGAPIVGTELDYFQLRGLEVAQGRPLAILGEALIGAKLADRTGLSVGDTIISRPENLFDLSGSYPLELTVVGILAMADTPDDEALFVDIRTSWVMEGIGHGHDDLVGTDAGVVAFQRITVDNIESFHFHGDTGAFPVSAVLAVPYDRRSEIILRGRYLDEEGAAQAVVPERVMAQLVETIFSVARLLDRIVLIVGAAAALAMLLSIHLSLQLRAREIETAFRLGARRGMTLQLLLAEGLILGIAAVLLAGAGLWLSRAFLAETLLIILGT